MVQGIVKVVAHIQVQMTVLVEIAKSRAHAPTTAFDAGLFRNLFKRAVMAVMKQKIAAVSRYVNILPSVVIVIRNGYTHSPAVRIRKTRLPGHVGEVPLAIAPVERTDGIAAIPPVFVDAPAAHQQNIQIAVVVG